MTTKICSKCGIEKLKEDFYKDNSKKEGVKLHCKDCILNYSKARYATSKEVRIRIKEATKKWFILNKDINNLRRRKEYENNPERRKKDKLRGLKWIKHNKNKIKKYRVKNKEKIKIYDRLQKHNRRGKNKQAGKINKNVVTILKSWNRDYFMEPNLHCEYCLIGIQDNWHLDHIQPLSKGGINDINNLAISCPSCNLQKHAKLLNEFYPGKIYYFNSRNFYFRLESLKSSMS